MLKKSTEITFTIEERRGPPESIMLRGRRAGAKKTETFYFDCNLTCSDQLTVGRTVIFTATPKGWIHAVTGLIDAVSGKRIEPWEDDRYIDRFVSRLRRLRQNGGEKKPERPVRGNTNPFGILAKAGNMLPDDDAEPEARISPSRLMGWNKEP